MAQQPHTCRDRYDVRRSLRARIRAMHAEHCLNNLKDEAVQRHTIAQYLQKRSVVVSRCLRLTCTIYIFLKV